MKKDQPPTFHSLREFIESYVEPRLARGWSRLDGKDASAGSSRVVAARFIHHGEKFKVDEDSPIAALLRPKKLAAERGISIEDSVLKGPTQTRNGKSRIKLKPIDGNDKGFYVYFDGSQ